jgi:hypothetical protein
MAMMIGKVLMRMIRISRHSQVRCSEEAALGPANWTAFDDAAAAMTRAGSPACLSACSPTRGRACPVRCALVARLTPRLRVR